MKSKIKRRAEHRAGLKARPYESANLSAIHVGEGRVCPPLCVAPAGAPFANNGNGEETTKAGPNGGRANPPSPTGAGAMPQPVTTTAQQCTALLM